MLLVFYFYFPNWEVSQLHRVCSFKYLVGIFFLTSKKPFILGPLWLRAPTMFLPKTQIFNFKYSVSLFPYSYSITIRHLYLTVLCSGVSFFFSSDEIHITMASFMELVNEKYNLTKPLQWSIEKIIFFSSSEMLVSTSNFLMRTRSLWVQV